MHFGKWALGPSLRAIVRSGGSRVTQVAFLGLVQIAEAAVRCRLDARRGLAEGIADYLIGNGLATGRRP